MNISTLQLLARQTKLANQFKAGSLTQAGQLGTDNTDVSANGSKRRGGDGLFASAMPSALQSAMATKVRLLVHFYIQGYKVLIKYFQSRSVTASLVHFYIRLTSVTQNIASIQ
jgi:hypothetical protein